MLFPHLCVVLLATATFLAVDAKSSSSRLVERSLDGLGVVNPLPLGVPVVDPPKRVSRFLSPDLLAECHSLTGFCTGHIFLCATLCVCINRPPYSAPPPLRPPAAPPYP